MDQQETHPAKICTTGRATAYPKRIRKRYVANHDCLFQAHPNAYPEDIHNNEGGWGRRPGAALFAYGA